MSAAMVMEEQAAQEDDGASNIATTRKRTRTDVLRHEIDAEQGNEEDESAESEKVEDVNVEDESNEEEPKRKKVRKSGPQERRVEEEREERSKEVRRRTFYCAEHLEWFTHRLLVTASCPKTGVERQDEGATRQHQRQREYGENEGNCHSL